jgi:hypothetical protein
MNTTSTRRPATAADLTVGTIVHKGAGKVAYRIVGTRFSTAYGETLALIVKATTVKVPATNVPYARLAELTIAA